MPKGKIIKALSGFYYCLDGDRTIQCRGRGYSEKTKSPRLSAMKSCMITKMNVKAQFRKCSREKMSLSAPDCQR